VRLGPGFAATLNCTTPLPIPEDPAVIANHDTVLVAVQGQPSGAVTLIVPLAPAEATVWAPEASANEQPEPD
jgi:hypothetical protein